MLAQRTCLLQKERKNVTEPVVYLNGRLVPASQAAVSVFDRGVRRGDAVFDTARTFRHRPYRLRQHLERLYRSLKYIRLDPGITLKEMEANSLRVLEHNLPLLKPGEDTWITQIVSRGGLRNPGAPTVVILTEPVLFRSFARFHKLGVPLITPVIRHTPPQSVDARVKTTSRMNLVLAELEAQERDPDALALLLDLEGNVTEYTSGNFFMVRDGGLMTAYGHHVLGGISRDVVIELAGDLGIPCRETTITPYDVYHADEAFITSTSKCILPVRSLNGIRIGKVIPGAVTKRLLEAWSEQVEIDIVEQALSHLSADERQALEV